ncbi:MAG: NAD(P)/FAD-dependent oxidoreductase [Dehalococcoidia bacterium]
MSKEERYDIVIVGGGPNGVTSAAYLAKSGLSVCVLEERPELLGGCENVEVIPGVRIDPHMTFMYAGAAPGFEQLELWKYGFRMAWHQLEPDGTPGAVMWTSEGAAVATEKDNVGWGKLSGSEVCYERPFWKELMQAIYWCPPHPPEVEITAENIPYMQVYKQYAPEMWTEEILDMSLFDLMDEYCETEAHKVNMAIIAWYCGASPEWQGVGIPSLGGAVNLLTATPLSVSRGGMHTYGHAVVRCALAHGAVMRTSCPVDEIIIREGRAVGVRLRDDAAFAEKTIWANKAVLANVEIKHLFLDLIGPKHVDIGFMQRIRDISLKGANIYVSHFLLNKPPRVRPKFRAPDQGDRNLFFGGIGPGDSRENYFEHIMDINGRKAFPSMPPEKVPWIVPPHEEDDSRVRRPNSYLLSPFYVIVPPPEYFVDGPDAMHKEKGKWDTYMRKALGTVVENLEDDLIGQWANSPWESEHRNWGLLGGGWYTTRHCSDQWFENRPLPELSRYRVPSIDGLYLCHQSSGHPGGLFLMAIPYNLMHILIEDGLVEPGDWWYPSPWYIPQEGKISAIPRI